METEFLLGMLEMTKLVARKSHWKLVYIKVLARNNLEFLIKFTATN